MIEKLLENYLLFIPVLVFILILIIFGVLSKKSNIKNKSYEKYNVLNGDVKNYSFKFDYNNNLVTIYPKSSGRECKVMSIDNLMKLIKLEDHARFKNWIDSIRLSKTIAGSSIYLTISNIESSISVQLFKLTYNDFIDNIVYCSAAEIEESAYVNATKVATSVDTFEELKIEYIPSLKKTYAFMNVNFGLYDIMMKRYGKEISEQYIKKLYYLLEKYEGKNTKICHYKDDSFIVIKSKNLRFSRTYVAAKKMIQDLTTSIFFYNFQVECTPTIGIAISTNETTANEIAEDAYLASLNTNEKRIRVYDDKLLKAKKKEKESNDALVEMFGQIYENTVLSPVISLLDGDTVGYLPEIRFNNKNFSNFAEAYQLASSVNKTTTFFYNALNQWFKIYNETIKGRQTMFIFTDIEKIFNLCDFVENNKESIKADIVAVMTDYSSIIDYPDRVRKLVRKCRDLGISLGIVANEKMLTSLSNYLHFFTWLIIPSSLSKNITTDNKFQFLLSNIIDSVSRFTMSILAWNVKDYSTAESLKKIGIDFMQGPLLDDRNNSNVVSRRQLSKLIDEGDLK